MRSCHSPSAVLQGVREVQLRLPRSLEAELCRNLTDPGIGCPQDLTEGRIADVSIDRAIRIELRVIEDVEHLQPKLKRATFGEACHFVKCQVVVVDSRSVEHAAFGVALRAERIWGERSRVEVRLAVTRVVVDFVP